MTGMTAEKEMIGSDGPVRGRRLDSDSLLGALANNELVRNPGNGLVDGVALLGTTVSAWREETLVGLLEAENKTTYNPRMSDWNPEVHPTAESEGLNNFAVLGVGLEQERGRENAGLGSLAEIGIALYTAKMKGSFVEVWVADGFEDSLTDPGARVQFSLVMLALNEMAATHPEMVRLKMGGSREEFGQRLIEDLDRQKEMATQNKEMTRERVEAIRQLRGERMSKPERDVVIGGGSKAFSESGVEEMADKYEEVIEIMKKEGKITELNVGMWAEEWNRAYKSGDYLEILRLAKSEWDKKTKTADVLVWMVPEEAIAMGAGAEIGLLACEALDNGQQFCALLEEIDWRGLAKEKMGKWLVEKEVDIDRLSFQEWYKLDGLRQAEGFGVVDNTIRVRAVLREQLAKLGDIREEMVGDYGFEPFVSSRDITDFEQRLMLIRDKSSFEKREKYFENYLKVCDRLDQLIEEKGASRENIVALMESALEVVIPESVRLGLPLTRHLSEATADAKTWRGVIRELRDDRGRPYLADEEMGLMENYAVPLHDLFKFLGSPDMQGMSDHEMMVGLFVERFFPKAGFSEKETSFVKGVVTEHENIFKEEIGGRRDWSRSGDPILRARAIFFPIDTLTGVVEMYSDGVARVNHKFLEQRFTDLYFRHIDGKVFRPEWAVHAVEDLLALFGELEERYGMRLGGDFEYQIVRGAMTAIDGWNPRVKNEKEKKRVDWSYRQLEKIERRYKRKAA